MAIQLTEKQKQEGWQVVKFGEIAREVKQSTKTALADGLEFYVGLEHLDPQSLRIERKGVIAEDNPSFTRGFKAGHILFGKRRSYQKKAAVPDFEGICSSDIIVIEAIAKKVLPDLLPFFVQSDVFFDWAVKTSSGSLSPRTKWKAIAHFELALPPIERQKEIQRLLEKASIIAPKYEAVKKSSERLFRKLLYDLVWEKQSSWEKYRIGSLGRVQMGRQRAPKYTTGRYTKKYLRVINVLDGFLELKDVEEMDFDELAFPKFKLKKSDILVTEGDIVSQFNVGRCAIWREEIANCCFQNTLIRFQAGELILPQFAYYLFRAAFYKGIFAGAANMTTVAHLGSTRFSKIKLGVPGLEEQERIIQILDSSLNTNTVLRDIHLTKSRCNSSVLNSIVGGSE